MAEHDVNLGGGTDADEPLVQAARGGCATSFGELTEHCRLYLLQVAQGELNAELRAKVAPSDLVQETMMQAQRSLISFRGQTEQEFRAWLRQILLNQARKAVRHFQGTAKREIRREVPRDAGELGASPIDLVDAIKTPSQQALANERVESLAEALGRLPAQYREIIELRNLKLHSFAEIGQRLSRSPDSARALWIRAVERLRREIKARDESY